MGCGASAQPTEEIAHTSAAVVCLYVTGTGSALGNHPEPHAPPPVPGISVKSTVRQLRAILVERGLALSSLQVEIRLAEQRLDENFTL